MQTDPQAKPDDARKVDAQADPPAPGLGVSVKCVAVVALVFTGLAATLGRQTAIGVGFGGFLAVANLAMFAKLGKAFLDRQGNSAPWAVLGILKLLGLFACVLLILRSGAVSALALAVGYGAMPVGIAISSLFSPKSSP